MKIAITTVLFVILSACATYSVIPINNQGRQVLIPTKRDFLIKTGGRTQVGATEYLVVGKMKLDNKVFSVIQLPHSNEGRISYCLITNDGKMYPRFAGAIHQDKEPVNTGFILVPMHRAKVIPEDVLFLKR